MGKSKVFIHSPKKYVSFVGNTCYSKCVYCNRDILMTDDGWCVVKKKKNKKKRFLVFNRRAS